MVVVLMGLGVIGTTMFQQETQRGLRVGESISLGHYTVTYEGSEVYVPPKEPDKTIFLGHVLVSTDGGAPERMSPYREVFRQGGGLLAPALGSTPPEDLS